MTNDTLLIGIFADAVSEGTMWVRTRIMKEVTFAYGGGLVSTLWPETEQPHNWNPLGERSHRMERSSWIMVPVFVFLKVDGTVAQSQLPSWEFPFKKRLIGKTSRV